MSIGFFINLPYICSMNNQTQLKIYKASAGSGKTFTLAASYIALLVQNPDSYRRILAVTFTNKATGEMKERILSQLYGIAHSLSDSDRYVEAVFRLLKEQDIEEDVAHNKLDEERIRLNAEKALTNILHNYSFFRIETIDSFMLSILRNLAKELDLGSNMDIELDEKKVISEGVNETIRQLSLSSPELEWIIEYIESVIDDEQDWNITKKLEKFAENLHKETYQRHSNEIQQIFKNNPKLINQLRQHLFTDRENARRALKDKAQQFFAIISQHGLEINDFAYGRGGVCGYFLSLIEGEPIPPKKRATDASEDPYKWTTTTSDKREIISQLAENKLIPLLNETEKLRQSKAVIINTCSLILGNLYQLQLIGSIDEKIQEISQKKNRWLLVDTCTMLMQMATGPSDTSFIYEKTGTEIDHILIDEFQDTSGIQWANFLPLIRENVSRGKDNLIVGDVKQAIYRFRDSNADIMEREIKDDLALANPKEIPLDTNFRSRQAIVDFNTEFFTNLTEALKTNQEEFDTEAIANFYKDVKQKVKEGNTSGCVRFLKVNASDKGSNDTATDAMCRATAKEIVRLLDAGLRQSDIAILTRAKKEITQIAEWITSHSEEVGRNDIRIISSEAFSLDSSEVVRLLISTLRWICSPLEDKKEDIVSLAYMGIIYHKLILKDNKEIPEILQNKDIKYGLPSSIIQQHDELAALPLGVLIYELYDRYSLNGVEGHDAYLQSLFDEVQHFIVKENGDSSQFIQTWDEKLSSKTIPAGNAEGIRAMTIHKAKGLEFHSVIVPFCEWKIESSATLWVSPNEKYGEGLPFVPIQRDASMKESIFSNEYREETRKLLTDNLNLLYVAFTRPTSNLIVLRKGKNEDDKTNKKSSTQTYSLTNVANLIELGLKGVERNDDSVCTLYDKEKEKSENPLLPEFTTCQTLYHSSPISVPFRQSNASRTYVNRGDDSPMSEFIEQGKLLHDIFAHIYTADDTSGYIDKLYRMGTIDKIQRKNISDFVRHALTLPEVKEWFDGTYQLYNECTILTKDETGIVRQNRPDRVMINGEKTIVVDFKFGMHHSAHEKQVKKYMDLLTKMGFKNVEGYLWYVTNSDIKKV